MGWRYEPLIDGIIRKYAKTTGDTMTGRLDGYMLEDTKNNILNTTPADNTWAYATDSDEHYFYVAADSAWYVLPLQLQSVSSIDMGATDPVVHTDRYGYYRENIVDKDLHNARIGFNDQTLNGGIRIDETASPDTLEVYLRSAWNTIIYDLTTSDGDFRHVPVGDDIYIWRGDSVLNGLNGQPITQEYETSMGAYGAVRQLKGGTF